jgi:hypothetical protein
MFEEPCEMLPQQEEFAFFYSFVLYHYDFLIFSAKGQMMSGVCELLQTLE